MALKARYQTAFVLVACAAVAIAMLPPMRATTYWSPRDRSASEELRRLSNELANARNNLNAVTTRDSLGDLVDRAIAQSAPAPALLMGSDIDAVLRTRISDAVAQHWIRLGLDSARYPAAIVVLTDSMEIEGESQEKRDPSVTFQIPAGDDHRKPCVSIVRLGSFADKPAAVSSLLRNGQDAGLNAAWSVAGPCAFYAAHGAPGAHIRAWLERRLYDFARNSDWSVTTSSEWEYFKQQDYYSAIFVQGLHNPYGLAERRCTLGNVDACTRLVTTGEDAAAASKRVRGIIPAHERWRSSEVGYRPRLLADMRLHLGPHRFDEFWHSERDPATALLDAAGISLGEFTRDWLVNNYGPAVSGAKVRAPNVIFGFLTAFASIGTAIVIARRRTVP